MTDFLQDTGFIIEVAAGLLVIIAVGATFFGTLFWCSTKIQRIANDFWKGCSLFEEDEEITERLLVQLEKKGFSAARVCRVYKYFKKRAERRKNKGMKIVENINAENDPYKF